MSSDSSCNTLDNVNTSASTKTTKSTHWHLVASHSLISPAVLNHDYVGSGTEDDPYRVEFLPEDPRDPMNFPRMPLFELWENRS